MEDKLKAFERLLVIMDELRAKCPWDKKQTMQSLSSLTVEETFELMDAIQKKNLVEIKEEIGDLMLHMVFYAKIAEELKAFHIGDALHSICDKLIRRHPHIYGDVEVEDDHEVKMNWERIKMAEGKESIFSGVPEALPPLIKAQRMQEKAAQVGFEWEHTEDVWNKVEEELDELRQAVQSQNHEDIREEFGDLIFALINYGRFLNVDVNYALTSTNLKFRERIEYIEKKANRPLGEMSLDEMDKLWDEAKTLKKDV